MSGLGRIAVVGASLAGLRAAEFIRRAKFDGELLLIGDEPHLPYDRPPLSKELLRGEWDPERIALRRKSYDELNIELVLGARAVSLDTDARRIHLDAGDTLAFDGLVIATGGAARALPGQPALEGIYTLRTLDDATRLRAAFADTPRVAVIGAGFIGAEVAASARQLGLDVTMIEALETPLAQSLGSTGGPSASPRICSGWCRRATPPLSTRPTTRSGITCGSGRPTTAPRTPVRASLRSGCCFRPTARRGTCPAPP